MSSKASIAPGPTIIRQTVLERAYELASSGTCASVMDVMRRLSAEGYPDPARALYGPVLKADLRQLCQTNYKAPKSE